MRKSDFMLVLLVGVWAAIAVKYLIVSFVP